MSRFYGSISGSRGEASRTGTPQSGLGGHIRGWNIGCRVEIFADIEDNDRCNIYITGGSNNSGTKLSLGSWCIKNGELTKLGE